MTLLEGIVTFTIIVVVSLLTLRAYTRNLRKERGTGCSGCSGCSRNSCGIEKGRQTKNEK